MQKSLTVLTSLLCLYGVSANASECIGAGCHISQYGTEPVAVVAPKCPATSSFKPYLSAKGMISILQTKSNVDATYPSRFQNHDAIPSKPLTPPNDPYVFMNSLSDKRLRDASFGFRLAYGATTPVKYGALRGELEFGYSTAAKDDNDYTFNIFNPYYGEEFSVETSVLSALANVYYDFNTGTRVTPYIGAGFGYARVTSQINTNGIMGQEKPYDFDYDYVKDNFAWQLGVGVAYNINENWIIDLGYRYADYGRIKESDVKYPSDMKGTIADVLIINGDFHVTAHEFTLGARYMF